MLKIAPNSRPAWLLILGLMVAPAFLPAQVSLGTVVDLAQRNSSTVRLAQADVNKAQAVLAQMHDAYVPSLNLRSGLPAVPSVGFTGGIPSIVDANAQSLVFSFPQRQYVAAARAGLKAATLSLNDAREQVALDASTAYIELDTVNTELESTHQQENFAERLVEIEQQRTEAGVDSLSDVLEARLSAAQLKLKHLHLETRAATLAKQLATLTGLPVGSITPDHASIPEIPAVSADSSEQNTGAMQAAQLLAVSKQKTARGDILSEFLPQLSFSALYSRSTTILNDFNAYYAKPIPINNFSSGFAIQLPIFDLGLHAKSRQSAAEALRATVEAEQAQQKNDVEIATLTSSLRELDTQAEIATLKQQIAKEQLQTVMAQLELGNGTESGPAAQPQLTPKAEQLARIDERQKYVDSLDAGFDLAKARLSLLRALGHMQDWLNEIQRTR